MRAGRRRGAAVVVASVVLTVLGLFAAPALAVATISPNGVVVAEVVTFTLSTSLDRAALMAEVSTTAPATFAIASCAGPQGWGCSVRAATDGTTITWEREASLNPTDSRFTFRATAPDEPGTYPFLTRQTYSDGASSSSSPTVVVAQATLGTAPTPEPSPSPEPVEPSPTPSPTVDEVPPDDGEDDELVPLRPPADRPTARPGVEPSPGVEAISPPRGASGDGDRVGRLFVLAVTTLALATVGGAVLAATNR